VPIWIFKALNFFNEVKKKLKLLNLLIASLKEQKLGRHILFKKLEKNLILTIYFAKYLFVEYYLLFWRNQKYNFFVFDL